MKGLFIGLVIGAIAVWGWYHTGGKISITETKTITNVVSVTKTQIVEQARWVDVYRTNEVWKTNMIEKTEQTAVIVPSVKAVTEQPKPVQSVSAVQPAVQQIIPAPTTNTIAGFKGPAPAGKVTHGRVHAIKKGVRKNMDGSVKE